MNRMFHSLSEPYLSKRRDLVRQLSGLQSLPIFQQFPLMEFSPCFNQTFFLQRERTTDYFDHIDAENSLLVLIICMEVRAMMLNTRFGEHSDDDAKKATNLAWR